jgi:formate dehydrogenase gamma subunit
MVMIVVGGLFAMAQDGSKPEPIEQGKNEACLACHGKDGMFDAGDKHIVTDKLVKASVHKDLACSDCHSEIVAYPHAKGTGKVECVMCHEETMTTSLVPRVDPPGKFSTSVHAPKGKPGDADLPNCLSCHTDGAHSIQKPQTWTKRQMADKCARCHADPDKMARHGIHVEAALSYFTSFHGKAIKYGSEKTATCVDCHNAHGVLNPKDQMASTNIKQRQATCAYCHKGASYNFAMAGTGHLDLTLEKSLPLRITNWLFISIAVFTFTMLAVALFMDVRKRMKNKGNKPTYKLEPATVVRWTVAQRGQHGLLTISITLLVLTGFPLRFPDATGMARIYEFMGGIGTARIIHRYAAVGLITVAVWHLAMLLYRWWDTKAHPREWPMLPSKKDVRDIRHTILYYLGKHDEPPKFARYSFREKMDYLCEYWGVPIMVVSGLILWFPGRFAEDLPGIVISMAYVAHGIEATIATIVILVWHMYNALLADGVRGNRAWWNGRVTAEYMAHHHPLEWERIQEERAAKAAGEAEPEEKPETP